jgi:hypothetical protein
MYIIATGGGQPATRPSFAVYFLLQFRERHLGHGDPATREFVDKLRPADSGDLGAL